MTTDPVGVGENVKLHIVTDQNGEKLLDATVVREEGVLHDGALRYEIAVEFEAVLPEIVVSHLKNDQGRQNDEEDEQGEEDADETREKNSDTAKAGSRSPAVATPVKRP